VTGPVIGVLGHHHVVTRPFGALPLDGAPRAYADAVRSAGGRPVLLTQDDALALLGILDGIVLTGGGDVDPGLCGAAPASALDVDRERDDAEVPVARATLATGLPLLGVCRGMQVLAVATGGRLVGGVDHVRPEAGHPVRTVPGSLVRELLGPRCRTSALHRQAVADPGPRWHVTAWADDGTVEAIEPSDPGVRALGVQWHPEMTSAPVADPTGPAIFGWLVRAAQQRRDPQEVLDDRPVLAGQR
jgi:putative glutamine amidotransferase